MSANRPCSSTSCVLQYGHQSADRKNTSTTPLGPITDWSVRGWPVWSGRLNAGTAAPTRGPSFSTSIVSADRWAVSALLAARAHATTIADLVTPVLRQTHGS